MMIGTATVKEQRRPRASLKRLTTVEAIYGYVLVPFYVFLQYLFPKHREPYLAQGTGDWPNCQVAGFSSVC